MKSLSRLLFRFSSPQVAEATADNVSSMLADIRRGVRTEVDCINGAVAQAGQSFGITSPVNSTITALVHLLEQTRTTQSLRGEMKVCYYGLNDRHKTCNICNIFSFQCCIKLCIHWS
jgi:hypothetical protein